MNLDTSSDFAAVWNGIFPNYMHHHTAVTITDWGSFFGALATCRALIQRSSLVWRGLESKKLLP